jgi:hypothetical protein
VHLENAANLKKHMNTSKSILKLSFLVVISLVALPAANAATYYVATNGVDTNPGTQPLPFKTIQHGIDFVANGDSIQVTPGTYFEHIVWTNKSLSLQGAGPGQSIIDGAHSGTCVTVQSGLVSPTGIIAGFTIQNGTAAPFAGGMVNYYFSGLIVSNCDFTANTGNGGGAIYNSGAAPLVTGCRFLSNSAISGAGMFNSSSSPIVSNCVFAGNTGSHAGAMYNSGGSPFVLRCTFTNNTANNGAGIFNWNSSPTVSNCVFAGNTSIDLLSDGGGMHNDADVGTSNPLVINCTFRSNNATWGGGGIYSRIGRPTLVNCTFTENGNIAVYNDAYCWATMANCIFWGNWSTNGSSAIYDRLPSVVTYSDVQGGWPGTGNLNADPLFVNAAIGNLRLQTGSPCINAGSATATNLPATDLDGAPRSLGGAPDMGAYESTAGLWFVDAALGNDTSAGTAAAPFAKVTKATTIAANGNSIYIRAGNYGTDRPRVTKSLRLFNWGDAGLARIGQP